MKFQGSNQGRRAGEASFPSVARTTQIAVFLLCFLILTSSTKSLHAQITGRATLTGQVQDATGAVVPRANVTVTNTATGVAILVTTNSEGIYRAGALLPGPYNVSIAATGFKALVRRGITLDIEESAVLDLKLDVGASTETVNVNADASQLNESGSDGQVVTNTLIENAPTPGANALLLLKFSRGVIANDASNVFMNGSYNAGGNNSRIGTAGQVSKNEFNIDGAPNQSGGHNVAYAPPSGEVNEMFTDTSGFDAQVGKTLGAFVTGTTKGGTNGLHGSANWLYEDGKWQAFTHFGRLNYINQVIPNCASGPSALCTLKTQQFGKVGTHENNINVTVGGPVFIPKVLDGRDKLFFFLSMVQDKFANVTPSSVTLATAQERGLNGAAADFTDLTGGSACPTNYTAGVSSAYCIYDPLTVAADPKQSGRYVRTAFPGNIIPASRFNNAAMIAFLNKELPLPNNGGPFGNTQTGQGNYAYNLLSPQKFTSYTGRIDYAPREKDHFYVRGTRSLYRQEQEGITVDNIEQQLVLQPVRILSADWTHTFNSRTVIDTSVGYTGYKSTQTYPNEFAYTPGSYGLPSYLDAQSALVGLKELSLIQFNGSTTTPYRGIGSNSGLPSGQKIVTLRSGLTEVLGRHSLKSGFEFRQQVAFGGGGGNGSGLLNFDNTFTKPYSDTTGGPQQLGLSYAAFLMGIHTSATQDNNTVYKRSSPYYALFVQDAWRITPRLTLNAGLRYEYEYGPIEAQDRQITYFDDSQALPIASGAQASYAANYNTYATALPAGTPAPPTTFAVQGGSVYAGVSGASRRAYTNNSRFLPRIALSYALTPKMLVRGGYGLFYDTVNALNQGIDQTGFSATTTVASTNDGGIGLNGDFVAGNPYAGVSTVSNPFPVSASGARFNTPVGSALGNMAQAGNSWTYYPRGYVPATQQRWQATSERQLSGSLVLSVDYTGSFTDRIEVSHNRSFVPSAYFTGGNVLNPNTSKLNASVPNPFALANFTSLQTSSPTVYNNLALKSFFTSKTITLSNLLRAFPQMSAVTERAPVGQSQYNAIYVSLQHRAAHGLEFAINYQRNFQYDRDFYANSFDPSPSYEDSNNSRPTRLTVSTTYQLPFGKGRDFATSGLKSALFGGFSMNGIYEVQQGALIGFGNLIYNGSNLSDIKRGGSDYGQWFNTANFDKLAADQLQAYNLRVFPTRVDGVRQQGVNNLNLNLQRTISFTDKVRLLARFECFDVFNHTIVGAPNTTPTSAQFGQPTGDGQSFARFIQIEGKLSF